MLVSLAWVDSVGLALKPLPGCACDLAFRNFCHNFAVVPWSLLARM